MEPGTAPLRMHFGAFDLDEANARLAREGVPLPVPPKAFGVLCTLLRHPGNLVTKDQLLDAVWGHRHVSESVLKTTISELRGVLDDDARAPRYVETAARRGYRFIGALAPLAVRSQAPPAAAPAAAMLVGRRAELDRLHALWAAAQSGPCQLCWIAGEAGIGKSTLIDALVAALGPAAHAQGQCVEQFGAGEPYLPVLDALGTLCRGDTELTALLRASAPGWLAQMPWLVGADENAQLREALAAGSQERMLREFAQLVELYTAGRPLLLVTEDLHWCDDATVRLLDYLARRRTPARLLWIGSFRAAELAAIGHPLNGVRHELRTRRLAHEILLEPFSETELADYLGRRGSGAVASEALVQRIHQHTDGLPLFVANVVEDLEAQGALPQLPERADTAWPLPPSLVGVVERQISRLSADTARLLEAAAVCGVQFSVALLAEVLAREPAAVARCCDELARLQDWIAPGAAVALADGSLDMQHAFRHAIYRQVFYERTGALERAGLHRRMAEALARRRDAGAAVSAAELAMHCEHGLDVAGALRAYVVAAENALARFAPSEALHLCTHGLALLPRCTDAAARTEAELALSHLAGAAHAQSGGISSPQARSAFSRAAELLEQLPDAPQRAWVLTGMAWMYSSHGEYQAAQEFAERLAQHASGQPNSFVHATSCCVSAVSLVQLGELRRARALLEQAVAATAQLERRVHVASILDPGVMSRAVGATALVHLGETARAQEWLQAALARAEAIGQPISRGICLRCAGVVLVRLDAAQQLHALATRMAQVASEHGLVQGQVYAQGLLGWAEARLGQAQQGHRRILAACEAYRTTTTGFDIAFVRRLAGEAAWLAQDRAAAASHVAEGLAQAQALDEQLHVPDLLHWRARLEQDAGEPAQARASLHGAIEAAQAMGAVVAELEARSALCRLPGAGAREFAGLRRLRASLAQEPLSAPLARADEVLAAAPRHR